MTAADDQHLILHGVSLRLLPQSPSLPVPQSNHRSDYFPIQKVEKSSRNTSSGVVSPARSASASIAAWRCVAAYSGDSPRSRDASAAVAAAPARTTQSRWRSDPRTSDARSVETPRPSASARRRSSVGPASGAMPERDLASAGVPARAPPARVSLLLAMM